MSSVTTRWLVMEQQEKEQCVKMEKQATEGKKLCDNVNVICEWI